MPIFKIPFHVSYILYISRFSPALARFYFRLALGLCKLTRTTPSLLLHPLDFLGCDDVQELAFFPAMDLTSEKKIRLISDVLDIYSDIYRIVPVRQQFRDFMKEIDSLPNEPKFRVVGNEPTTKNIF